MHLVFITNMCEELFTDRHFRKFNDKMFSNVGVLTSRKHRGDLAETCFTVSIRAQPYPFHLACGATIVHMQLRCPRHWYLGHPRVVRFLRNFDRLVLGCIEADVASKISNTHVAGVWGSPSFVQISEFFSGVYPFGSLTFAQL